MFLRISGETNAGRGLISESEADAIIPMRGIAGPTCRAMSGWTAEESFGVCSAARPFAMQHPWVDRMRQTEEVLSRLFRSAGSSGDHISADINHGSGYGA